MNIYVDKRNRSLSTAEAEEHATKLLADYAEIKPPALDNSGTRAKRHIITLLTKRKIPLGDLERAIRNYRQFAERHRPDPKYRYHAGNFFGRDGPWKEYASPDWQLITPTKRETSNGNKTVRIRDAGRYRDRIRVYRA